MNALLISSLIVAVALPAYSYLGYPLLLGLLARRVGIAAPGAGDAPARAPPAVAIVVAAHNEEQHVDSLVASLRAIQYGGRLRIHIGSDGSTDSTAARLRARSGDDLVIHAFTENRGKVSVLNDLVAAVTEPVIVFTDANTLLDAQSVSLLVRHFDDPQVGLVCGELLLRHAGSGDNVDGLYWRIERFLKRAEAGMGALLGANGAIYAIRRECYVPLARDTVVDDFCVGMDIAARGKRLVYEPAAVARELAPPSIRDEVARRIRIGIGNYQACFRHPEYLWRGGVARSFAYVSHKVLRWFTPHFLALALLLTAALSRTPPFGALLLLQLAVYVACALAYVASRHRSLPGLLRIPVFLVSLNAALAVGFWRYATGQYGGSWRRTRRA